jgi:hypothetical protein
MFASNKRNVTPKPFIVVVFIKNCIDARIYRRLFCGFSLEVLQVLNGNAKDEDK